MSSFSCTMRDDVKEFKGKKHLLCNWTFWLLISITVFSLGLIILSWLTDIFSAAIVSNLQLRNGSLSFAWWQRPTVRPVYRIHIFNYTNVKEFEAGQAKRLHVNELGPYVYRETLARINPEVGENGTLSYQEIRNYQWEGGCPDDELVTVPNVPLFTAMAYSRDMNFIAQVSLTAVLSTIRAKPFIQVSAGHFLWGYDDELFRIAKPMISWKQNILYDKFGMLAFIVISNSNDSAISQGNAKYQMLQTSTVASSLREKVSSTGRKLVYTAATVKTGRNFHKIMCKKYMPSAPVLCSNCFWKSGLSKDKITINTGAKDLLRLGDTIMINGRRSRYIWEDEECDKIEGSDGSMFPPELVWNRNKILKVYAKEMCRSISLQYNNTSEVKGIPTLRYKLLDNIFDTSSTQNSCFCQKNKNDFGNITKQCPPKGIFNTSACNFGAPMLSSFPHFYKGDNILLKYVDGLEPKEELHDSYLDLHGRLGVPIGGWSRIQLNLEARKADAVPFMGSIQDGTILPILWIEIGIDEVPEPVMNILYHAHFTANTIESCLRWGSVFSLLYCTINLLNIILNHRSKELGAALHKNIPFQDPLIID